MKTGGAGPTLGKSIKVTGLDRGLRTLVGVGKELVGGRSPL